MALLGRWLHSFHLNSGQKKFEINFFTGTRPKGPVVGKLSSIVTCFAEMFLRLALSGTCTNIHMYVSSGMNISEVSQCSM